MGIKRKSESSVKAIGCLIWPWWWTLRLRAKCQAQRSKLASQFSAFKPFEGKLKLLHMKLESADTVHSPALQEQKPALTSEHTDVHARLLQVVFLKGFRTWKANWRNWTNWSARLKATMSSKPDTDILLDFYKLSLCPQVFPIVRVHALEFASLLETTYSW